MTVEQLNVIVSANKTDFDNKIRAVKNELSTMQTKAQSASSGMLTAFKGLAAGLTALGIANFFKDANQSYITQMENELKLATVMKQRMGVTEEEISQVKELASEQQKLGIIGDEVQLAGAQQIATFATESDTIKTLIPAMNNLLAQQKGYNATASDAVSIGNLMGKVLQGQTSALTRVGITFTEAQENVLKYGTEEQRAAMLAQVITDNVGEMNEALRNTPTGQMEALKNDIGDVKEQIGATLQPLISSVVPIVSQLLTSTAPIIGELSKVMSGLASGITDIATRLENATPAQKTALKIALGMAVAIPAVTAATRLLTAAKAGYSAVMSFLIPKQLTFASALKATMGWIGLIAGALALIGIFNNDTAESTEDISDKLKSENEAAKKASESIDNAAESTDNLTGSVKRSVAGFDELNKLGGNGTVASGIVSDEDIANADEYADTVASIQDIVGNEVSLDVNTDNAVFSIENLMGNIDNFLSDTVSKFQRGEIGKAIADTFGKLSVELKPALDKVDELLGTDLDDWLAKVGKFVGDVVTEISNGDIEGAVDSVIEFVETSITDLGPGVTSIVSTILGGIDTLLGTSFQKTFDACASYMEEISGLVYNFFNDTQGKAKRSNDYANMYQDMINYGRDWMIAKNNTSSEDAYAAVIKNFGVDKSNEELYKWFNENGIYADLLEYLKNTGQYIRSGGYIDPEVKANAISTLSPSTFNPYEWYSAENQKRLHSYASGGFPDYGSLFIANEAGPELVGTLGGRTAVVNNSQIENALYNAVRSAISEGQMSQQGGDIRVSLEVDGEVLAEVVERQNRIRNKRFNGR